MFDKNSPFQLEDIFSLSFKLIKRTWKRNLLISAIFIIPAGLIFAYGFNTLFSGIFDLMEELKYEGYDRGDYTILFDMMNLFGLYFLSIGLFVLGQFFAKIGITKISYGEMLDDHVSINGAFQSMFSMTFWRVLGQSLLFMLVVVAFWIAFVLCIILISVSNIAILTLLFVLIMLALIAAIIYLSFRWYFAFIAIVGEDAGVLASFSKSSFLVDGCWWRTFGIIILINLAVQFALSVATTPLSFILMWDFFSEYFKMIANGSFENNDPRIFIDMFKSMGFSFGLLIIISTILQIIIIPLFEVVMYFDLKVRKKDFPELLTPVSDETPSDGVTSIE